jgi:hypothetical protein
MQNKLIRNSTAEFLIFTSQSGKDSIEVNIFEEQKLDEKVVCQDFRHTDRISDNSVSSKMETTCKKILQVQYTRG